MSIFHNNSLAGAGGQTAGGYAISRSLRFNSSDSAYLSRTPASSGNRKTWTWAGWVKRSSLGTGQSIFSAIQDGNNGAVFRFNSADNIEFFNYVSGNYAGRRVSSAVYRDTSAWYHFVLVWDSTNATAANRIRLYVNGVEVTAFSTTADPASADSIINSSNSHYLGADVGFNTQYLPAYLADIHFIDGQALDPTSFGEFSATTGVWVPKQYAGTYGTNGFHLDFSNNASAAALGTDSSGQGNTWTVNNLSVTAGAGSDSLVDVPTNGSEVDTGSGGQVRGNYCTGNPLAIGGGTLSNGNLDHVRVSDPSGNTCGKVLGTIAATSGKWYFEYTIATSSTSSAAIGITSNIQGTISAIGGTNYVGIGSYEYVWRAQGQTINNGSFPSYGTAASNGDTIMCAFDVDAGKVWFGRNGTWFNSSNPSAGTSPAFAGFSGTVMPIFGIGTASAGFDANGSINFGQRPFAYTAPSGFKALCTANLPAPTIVNPSTVFDTKLYTSNAGTLTVSGLGFSPDFAWLKSRGTGVAHALYDTVRGAGRALKSNTTEAEQYTTDGFVSFNSDGFTLGANNNSPQPDINYTNNVARVAWCWDAGSSTVTNTQGSITSSVRTNNCLSVVTYTGTGVLATVGHGLGIAPSFYIIKRRNSTSEWTCYHSALGATKYITLQSTAAAVTTANAWNNTAPTSSVFTINSVYGDLNANGGTYVAYCFAPVAGYSSFGSYTGNGSTDGPFVYCGTGFRPRWIMIKIANSTGNWYVLDAARNTYNAMPDALFPNLSNSETNSPAGSRSIDFLSNGFKIRGTDNDTNLNGYTYIYAAFAESPFQYARAR